MATYHTLTYNIAAVLGVDPDGLDIIHAFVTSQYSGIADTDSNVVKPGTWLLEIDATTTAGTVDLPATDDDAFNPAGAMYVAEVKYNDRPSGKTVIWRSCPSKQFFQMTADRNLADVVSEPVTIVTEAMRDDIYATAQLLNEQQAATDGQVETSLESRGLPTSGAELSTSIDQVIDPAIDAEVVRADATYATPGSVVPIAQDAAADFLATDPGVAAAAEAAVGDALAGIDVPTTEDLGDSPTYNFAVYHEDRETVFGQRTDGSFYPPAKADLDLAALRVIEDSSTGWLWTIRYANREVAFGQRTDGTYFPDSLSGSADRVVINGDSLTGNWSPYVNDLAGRLGLPVEARGNGGRTSQWIAARQGGQPLRVTLTGNAIPASGAVAGTVAVAANAGTTANIMAASTLLGSLGGIAGALTISDDAGTASFTRTAPGRITPLGAGTAFITGLDARDAWPIFWVGRNNWKLTGDGTQILADLTRMMAYTSRPDRALILSIPPWVGEENGQSIRTTLDAVNTSIRDAFPTAFENTSARLRSADLMAAIGVTPTSTDLQNITDGITPESLRLPADSGHLNDKGYAALNILIADIYAARGWI